MPRAKNSISQWFAGMTSACTCFMAERKPLPGAMLNSMGWPLGAINGSRTQYTRKALLSSADRTINATSFFIIPTVDSLALLGCAGFYDYAGFLRAFPTRFSARLYNPSRNDSFPQRITPNSWLNPYLHGWIF
jgi:hypothetical protein